MFPSSFDCKFHILLVGTIIRVDYEDGGKNNITVTLLLESQRLAFRWSCRHCCEEAGDEVVEFIWNLAMIREPVTF